MTKRTVLSVLSSGEDLAALLREVFPDGEVLTAFDPLADLIIVDDLEPPASTTAVLRLGRSKSGDEDSLQRDSFVRDPRGCVRLALEAVRLRRILNEGAVEIAFAQQIRELMTAGDLEVVFGKIGKQAAALAGAQNVVLLLHDPVIERFAVAFSSAAVESSELALGLAPGSEGDFLRGVPPDVLQQAIAAANGFAVRPATAKRGALLIIPLMVGEDLIGLFTLAGETGREIEEDSAAAAAGYVRSVAPLLITVHQLSKSKDLALRDDLTKAFNRRFFDNHLDEEIERARRYNSLVSVIFLDLDDLKLVNNRYGHLTGSRMLQEVARRILGAVRGIDKVVRFGGDEFCIILPQTDPDQARAVATRVRKAMSERTFHLEPEVDLAMTASFGIATYPVHARNKEDLIRAADTAMYRVKSTSKNAIAEAVRLELPAPIDVESAH